MLEIDPIWLKEEASLLEEKNLLEISMEASDFYDDHDVVKKVSKRYAFACKVLNLIYQLKEHKSMYQVCLDILHDSGAVDLHDDAKQQQEQEALQFALASDSLEELLSPVYDLDDANVIVEIRAGTGGEEASLFAKDLLRMYSMYALSVGWQVDILSTSFSEQSGYKEVIVGIKGQNVYRYMQYEAGGHRVQRVPATESQGRLHTSLVTMVVLIDDGDTGQDIEIDMKDVRVETFRATGPGGQHVNTTDSAVRLVHEPSGVVVQCQDEKNQHKNKEKALRVLKARVNAIERARKRAEEDALRQGQQGSGDRSEKIKTYNYNQNRLTDHRLSKSWFCLDRIMDGEIDSVLKNVVKYMRSSQRNNISEET